MAEVEMLSSAWAIIKNVGSLGGLVSAGFLLWDRATRGRPYARLVVQRGEEIPEENRVLLRVFNPGDKLMLAQAVISAKPTDLYLSADDETFQRMGELGIMVLPPGSHLDLHIDRQDEWHKIASHKILVAKFRWKYASGNIIRWWKIYRVKVSKSDFEAIEP